MVNIDVNKRPGAEKREHPREAKTARQHIAQNPLVTEQSGKITQRGAQMERLTPVSWQRFADKQADHQRGQQGHQREDPEDGMPAKPDQHRPANHRRHQRRNGRHQHDKRHHP